MSGKFEQWKENLQRSGGENAFVSKNWLRENWKALQSEAQPVSATKKARAPSPAISVPSPSASTAVSTSGESLEAICKSLGEGCGSRLCATKTKVVFGEGNPKARVMFVGEGPGEQEDLEGRPFVGRAGQLLTKIIEAMGLSRSDVYIANVVKCRPPGNRTPLPDEVALCEPFLFRQIEAIKPEIIVGLGGTALKCLLHTEDVKITKVRGTLMDYRGTKLMPTFHPAYLLRNPPAKKEAWEDMKKVLGFLNLPVPAKKE